MKDQNYNNEHYTNLLTELEQQTFFHSYETAKPIVDEFIKAHPELLDRYSKEFLYKV